MRVRGKPAHNGPDLGDDDVRAEFTDSRNGDQLFDGVAKAGKASVHLLIDLGDAGIERIDLLQMKPEQETMLPLNPALQRFA